MLNWASPSPNLGATTPMWLRYSVVWWGEWRGDRHHALLSQHTTSCSVIFSHFFKLDTCYWIIFSCPGSSCCGAPSSSCTRPRWLSSRSPSPATSCSLSSQTASLRTWRRGCCRPLVSVSVTDFYSWLKERRGWNEMSDCISCGFLGPRVPNVPPHAHIERKHCFRNRGKGDNGS